MDTTTTYYRNSVEKIDLKNNLDKISFGDASAKLIETYNLLKQGGLIEITGLDLREIARNLYLDNITSIEFYDVLSDSKSAVSMTERAEQLESVGFTITYSVLNGMRYYIRAKK